MTAAVDQSGADDADFQQTLARIEAAPAAEESLRERVARALWDAIITKWDVEHWDEQGEELRDEYRRLADAAPAVVTAAQEGGGR